MPVALPPYELNPVQLNQAQIEEVARFECNRRCLPAELQPGQVTLSQQAAQQGTMFEFAAEDSWGKEQRGRPRHGNSALPTETRAAGSQPSAQPPRADYYEAAARPKPGVDGWLIPEKPDQLQEPEAELDPKPLKPWRRMTYRDNNYRRQGDYDGRGCLSSGWLH